MTLDEKFMVTTKMVDKNGKKDGVIKIVKWLSSAEMLNRMVVATQMGLPVLTLVAADLEREFDENSDFPVVKVGDDFNSTNRQNTGRIVKFLMKELGFKPVVGKLDPQCRIPAAMKAEHFSTSAVYVKDPNIEATYEVCVDVREV